MLQFPDHLNLWIRLWILSFPFVNWKQLLRIMVLILVENRALESDKSGIEFHTYYVSC